MLKFIRDFYLRARYGFSKRPERFKIHGMVAMAPARFHSEEERYVRAAIVDISASGAAVECFAEHKVDEEVVLEFTLPTHKVSLAGVIMRKHAQPPTWVYGVKFEENVNDKHALRQVLAFAREEMAKMRAAAAKAPPPPDGR